MPASPSPDIKPIALVEIGGEPRAKDLEIGKGLGFSRPRAIRDLIKRNLTELEAFGAVQRGVKKVRSGKGRESEIEEFFLNEEQALLVAVLSDTDNAPAVRRELIQVFVAWRRGHLVSAQPQPVVTIQSLLDNPPQLLALAQGFALQVEDLKRDKAIMQQDVDVMDRLGRTDDTFGVKIAASMLGMQDRRFVKWLIENEWAYRQNGSGRLMAYAAKRKAGYMTHRPDFYRKEDGSEGVRETLVFYMAGLIKLAKIFNVTLQTPQADLLEGTAARPRP